eukprot:2486813-Ditylum_brightwellii.AAC.1
MSCAFTDTIRTPFLHHHCHHGADALPSATATTVLAPRPINGTNDVGGLQCMQNCSRQHCSLTSLICWNQDFSGKGSGGDMGEAMVQKRLEHWLQSEVPITAL